MRRCPVPLVLLAFAACVPKLESSTTERPYPLSDFHGPDTMPTAPAGTLSGFDLAGSWRVADVRHQDGDVSGIHLFQPGWFLVVSEDDVTTVQGLPPELYLPAGLEWKRNTVDRQQLALGFGFDRPRGDLAFLHYAFVMAGTDGEHARATEAIHFKDVGTDTIVWSIWTVDLERVRRVPDVLPTPLPPQWPR